VVVDQVETPRAVRCAGEGDLDLHAGLRVWSARPDGDGRSSGVSDGVLDRPLSFSFEPGHSTADPGRKTIGGALALRVHPMKTKAGLADFLREASGDVVVPNGDMVDIFNDVALPADTVNQWLKNTGLNFEASPSQGTVAQWSFRRRV
jgi:hypothetical protein